MIQNLVVGIIIAVITAITTVWLSFRRFRSERCWDRKADAYLEIIIALHHMIKYCEKNLDDVIGVKELAEEEKKVLSSKFKEAISEISKARDVGSFVISREAVKQLDGFLDRSISWSGDPYGYLQGEWSHVSNCLNAIREIARRDLKIE